MNGQFSVLRGGDKGYAAKLVINFKREVTSFPVFPFFQTLYLQVPDVSVSFVSKLEEGGQEEAETGLFLLVFKGLAIAFNG